MGLGEAGKEELRNRFVPLTGAGEEADALEENSVFPLCTYFKSIGACENWAFVLFNSFCYMGLRKGFKKRKK